jgi:hypothetical protein
VQCKFITIRFNGESMWEVNPKPAVHGTKTDCYLCYASTVWRLPVAKGVLGTSVDSPSSFGPLSIGIAVVE